MRWDVVGVAHADDHAWIVGRRCFDDIGLGSCFLKACDVNVVLLEVFGQHVRVVLSLGTVQPSLYVPGSYFERSSLF